MACSSVFLVQPFVRKKMNFPAEAEASYEKTNRAKTVQSPIFRGYTTKKSVKSYDSTLF